MTPAVVFEDDHKGHNHGHDDDHDGHDHGHDDHEGQDHGDHNEYEHLSDVNVWLFSLVGTLIISVASVTGVAFFFFFGIEKVQKNMWIAHSCAAGALVGACFLHIFPEGEMLCIMGGMGESDFKWKTGFVTVAGIMTGVIITRLFPHQHMEGITDIEVHPEKENQKETFNEMNKGLEMAVVNVDNNSAITLGTSGEQTSIEEGTFANTKILFDSRKYPFYTTKNITSKAGAIIFADMFHNIFDGVVLATAFRSCGNFGWIVMFALLAHELPSEIADFFVMLGTGLTIKQVLFWNFFSACSSFLGVIVVLSIGDLSATSQGLLLIYGCSVLCFIGMSLILPEILKEENSDRANKSILFFFIGICVLGLPLLFHEHCVAAGAHAGHDH